MSTGKEQKALFSGHWSAGMIPVHLTFSYLQSQSLHKAMDF